MCLLVQSKKNHWFVFVYLQFKLAARICNICSAYSCYIRQRSRDTVAAASHAICNPHLHRAIRGAQGVLPSPPIVTGLGQSPSHVTCRLSGGPTLFCCCAAYMFIQLPRLLQVVDNWPFTWLAFDWLRQLQGTGLQDSLGPTLFRLIGAKLLQLGCCRILITSP